MICALGAVAALLAGCAAGGTASKPGPDLAKSQVLRIGLYGGGSGDIATLDPAIVSDAASQMVIDLLYDPLVTLDPHMGVEDWGAARVGISADGLVYTFHLRAGQRFTNGTPVTAANYAYSLDRTLNPCLASPVSYYLFAINDAQRFANETCRNGTISLSPGQSAPVLDTLLGDGITLLDANTMVITLAQPAGYFLTALTYPVGDALDPSVIGPDLTGQGRLDTLSKGPHGQGTSGMFAVRSWDHQSGKLVLAPNPHWWGLAQGKQPYVTEIDFTLYRDESTAVTDFQHGRTDLVIASAYPTGPYFGAISAQPDHRSTPAFIDYSLTMDWTRAPYNNPDARAALCLALDRDALNQRVYGGLLLPTWHIVPSGMPGYNASLTGPDGVTSTHGDPAAARVHWQAYLQSLHGAPPPALAYFYDGDSSSQTKLATALAQQWQTVLGITVTPRAIEYGYLQDSVTHFPLTRFAWQADYPDPQNFLSLLLTAGSQYNPGGVSVPEADTLTQQADASNDPAQRYALYNQAEQLYINAVAWCPIFQGTAVYLARGQVHGWQLDGRGLTPNDAWLATYIART
jgi:peptide/nickel transport system substrate-binding protein/oligopeptide transport system substrate-binding protein